MALRRDQRLSSAAAMRRALREADKTPRPEPSRQGMETVAMPPRPTDGDVQDDEGQPDETLFDSESETQINVGDLSKTQRHHLDYWTAFRSYMERRGSFIVPTKPPRDYWMSFAVGRSNFYLDAYNGMRDKWIGVGLVLSGNNAKPHFHLL